MINLYIHNLIILLFGSSGWQLGPCMRVILRNQTTFRANRPKKFEFFISVIKSLTSHSQRVQKFAEEMTLNEGSH